VYKYAICQHVVTKVQNPSASYAIPILIDTLGKFKNSMNERMNVWMKEWMNERMNEWTNEQMNEWKIKCMNEQMNDWMSEEECTFPIT
jgi:predicted membrane chloride channel (bestrophin family)